VSGWPTPEPSRARNCNTRGDANTAAQAAVLSARQQLAANRARVDGTTIQNHPDVQNAAAAVRAAYLAYARTTLPAPVVRLRGSAQRSAGPAESVRARR